MRETPKSVSPKSPSMIKQALTVNRKPFPWLKAFCAGLAAALPVIIGLLFGNLEYGLIAGMGGFTYLYVFNIPYAQRAKKLFFVILGMTLASALGTLAAPYPLAVAILIGLIGAASIFIFGALKIKGPSAIFFVLVFAMTTGKPVDPELVWLRAGLVFLGGALSWVVAMIGWFFDPHGPETGVVKNVYSELAAFLDTVGTEKYNEARQKVMSDLKEAEETLAVGYVPWKNTDIFNRLVILNVHANSIFLYVLENFSKTNVKLPHALGEFLREMARSLDQKNNNEHVSKISHLPETMDESVLQLFKKITDADAIMNEPASKINQENRIYKPSTRTIFMGAFDKNSIVFISAVRFGIVTMFAAMIAYQFEFTRPFWVPLSCVAVMSGFTIVATYHRAIQRAFGTILGILIASLILMTHPTGFIIALFILLLTFITELFIVKNYGLAALFFTPNALLMAESTSHGSFTFSYFATARLIDIFTGTIIGLIGVFFAGRRSASSRLPHLITKTIRSQAQLLLILFSDQGNSYNAIKSQEIMKMRTNLNNLKTLYDTAAGEIPINKKALEYYWPVIFSIEHLGYLLENCSKSEYRPILSHNKLSQLLYVCETMANAANRKLSPSIKDVPEIDGYPSIQIEIITLQKSLQIDDRGPF
ncbi:putative membrane protein YccC [Neobacillus niacini]|uniref:FUSC family protein n=1 Tax=Neobacillus driksii TaxID=3035913 RepID=UPI00277ED42B|nr:FUSC family protein [Neobacillus niacini]MDQ0970551.1 putative membrane protein YccC [Neobacillus niacini]